jgi:cytochrome oxidase assembly protein ShyY1
MAGIVWSKRLAKLLVVAVLVAVTCVALGIWQIARLHQKQQFNAAVRAGLALAPAPVDAVLTDGVGCRAVSARSNRDVRHGAGFVLYGRRADSQAGNHR